MDGIICAPSQLPRIRELTNHICEQECDVITFFNICPDLLCIVDYAGKIIQVNSAWRETLRWTEDEMVGRELPQFVQEQDVEEMHRIMGSLRESQIVRFYVRMKAKNSEEHLPMEWVATLATDGNAYISAREIPELCMECRRARFMRR